MTRPLIMATLTFLITSWSGIVLANSGAVDLAQEAAAAYKDGRFKDAIKAFKAANQLQPDPVLDVNIGRCYEKLGQLSEALLHCKVALSASGANSSVRKAAQACVVRLEPKLERATFKLKSVPTNATVRIDGRVVGQTPWAGKVAPGRRQLDMTFEGHRPYSRSVIAAAGKIYNHTAQLIPDNVGALLTITTVPPGAEVRLDGSVLGRSPVRRVPVDTGSFNVEIRLDGHITQYLSASLSEGSHLEKTITLVPNDGIRLKEEPRWPAWTLVGTGLTMATVGAVFGVRALSQRNKARDLATTSQSASDYSAYRNAVDSFRTSQVTADLLYVGGILSITSGLLFFEW